MSRGQPLSNHSILLEHSPAYISLIHSLGEDAPDEVLIYSSQVPLLNNYLTEPLKHLG